MSRDPALREQVEAALEAARRGEVPPVPEHVPEPAGATMPGLTYCMRCGRLLASDKRGPASGAAKPCREVRITTRARFRPLS